MSLDDQTTEYYSGRSCSAHKHLWGFVAPFYPPLYRNRSGSKITSKFTL